MTKPKQAISDMKKAFRYDPETGEIFRVTGERAGKSVGHVGAGGYMAVTFNKVTYRFHRLAWALHTGAWPKGQIDHRDGVRTNNRWDNLRDVTAAVNSQNKRQAYRNNQAKVQGATPLPGGGYMARMFRNGQRIYLGVHPTAEAAGVAYKAAKAAFEATREVEARVGVEPT